MSGRHTGTSNEGSEAVEGDYEIGYRKPPRQYQFPKGVSGNYAGRPPKARADTSNASSLDPVVTEASRKIKVREGDREIELTAQVAVMRAQFMSSIKGNATAQREYLRFTRRALTDETKRKEQLFLLVYRYKVFWTSERDRLKTQGMKLPRLPINPDWIHFDKDLNVHVLEPMSRSDQLFWNKARRLYEDEIEELAYVRKMVREDPSLASYYAPTMKRSSEFIKFLRPHVDGPELELLDI